MRSAYVALLRGVNLGSKNKVPMPALRAMFIGVGALNVESYIQSGNILFRATPKSANKIIAAVCEEIARQFGFHAAIVIRNLAELEDVLVSNPFLATGRDEDDLHVFFLRNHPASDDVAKLNAGRSPGDEFHVRGRDIYLYMPNGVARSRLTNAYFDSQLKTVSTARNWRTVKTLVEMLRAQLMRTNKANV